MLRVQNVSEGFSLLGIVKLAGVGFGLSTLQGVLGLDLCGGIAWTPRPRWSPCIPPDSRKYDDTIQKLLWLYCVFYVGKAGSCLSNREILPACRTAKCRDEICQDLACTDWHVCVACCRPSADILKKSWPADWEQTRAHIPHTARWTTRT